MSEQTVSEPIDVHDDSDDPRPPRWLRPARDWVLAKPGGAVAWRVGVGLLGLAIVGGGVLLIPLPGPGWAIVFLGLAVWASEFAWARRLLQFAQRRLTEWTQWAKRQSLWVQGLIGLAGLLFLAGLAYLGWRFFLG